MEKLPDDVVLEILKYVDVGDLFACRLVCKRLERLCRSPYVWRHRYLRDEEDEDGALCPSLRIAPCLSSIVIATPAECSLVFSTRCAVAKLRVHVHAGGSLHAALVIRNQEALGRLKELDVFLFPGAGADARVLFETLAVTSGLGKVSIYGLPASLPYTSSPHDNVECVSSLGSSLRSFSWNVAIASQHTAPHYNILLDRHAATLEDVQLTSFFGAGSVFASSALTAPLLARMASLRVLACHLLPGLPVVAQCESLREVKLYVTHPQTQPDYDGAAEFLRRADQLKAVLLLYRGNYGPGDDGVDLVSALAASGRSQVESLSIGNECRDDTFPQLQPLLGALPSLPALRDLLVDVMPQELLQAITPALAPGLRSLKLRVHQRDSLPCIHSWLHLDAIKSFLLANPSLELHLLSRPKFCTIVRPCTVCSLGCQYNLWKDSDPGGDYWLTVTCKDLDH
ncbi:uncharacterized protein LOC113212673 [Frankliniella occidentalis]|uniref:Uncharacterized protein LOC113212673 n=1 Tax=Frankliniella occidentalis TaxID=133901 RepID=A0A6J1T148_FRAOC|nr:uncharacterized protein LOC113212673 [Frankliniella occidentalis]